MRHPSWTPSSRSAAETPEDIYGPLIECSKCEAEYYSGYDTTCPRCGFDPFEGYGEP